jgi:hypothetical protein
LADPRFKQFDALRNRRLRQTQDLGGTLEPGLFDTAARADSNL